MRKKYPVCNSHPFSPYIEYSDKQPEHDSLSIDNTVFSTLSDIKKRELLLKAASNGNNRAIWMIAVGYQAGWYGFPVDKQGAMRWYKILVGSWEKDAKNGDKDALELLKFMDDYKKGYTKNSK